MHLPLHNPNRSHLQYHFLIFVHVHVNGNAVAVTDEMADHTRDAIMIERLTVMPWCSWENQGWAYAYKACRRQAAGRGCVNFIFHGLLWSVLEYLLILLHT